MDVTRLAEGLADPNLSAQDVWALSQLVAWERRLMTVANAGMTTYVDSPPGEAM